MKKALIVCLLAAAVSMAQRQSVVVLPSIADQDAKLSPRQLDLLTDKVRSIIPNILPLKDFNLLKQGVVEERLGEEGLYLACKEGSCVGDLVAQVQADFGARCEVLSVNSQLYLKFELYGTLKGERDAGTIDQFNDLVKDFAAMLVLLDKKVPVALKKIIAEPAAQVLPPVQYVMPAVSEEKNDAEAYFKRGVKYFYEIDHDKALSEFTEAIRLNPNYAEAYGNRGMAYGNKGDYDRAVSDYTQAIRLNPNYAEAYYNRGMAYLYKKNYDRAIADWKSALLIDPNHSGAQEALESITAPTLVVDGVLTDSRDGKKYKAVEIGDQIWMAENLDYEAEGSLCYDNDEANCNKYGRLYNWETAKTACPFGWYLPSDAEWTVLEKYVGGSSTAGTKLKATSGWNDYGKGYGDDHQNYDGNGTDEFGFLALPGGYGRSDDNFKDAGNSGTWWSASYHVPWWSWDSSGYADSRRMRNNNKDLDRNDYRKSYLFSVRCLQGQAPPQHKPRSVRLFYISPKYQLPIGTPVPWGGIALGLGWIWRNGVFFGADGNWGFYDDDGDFFVIGIGLSLGYSHDLPSHFKLAYGGSLGLWSSQHPESYSFAAPFVKLRWRYLEASYKIFLGITHEHSPYGGNECEEYFGVTMHELAIGFYFGGW